METMVIKKRDARLFLEGAEVCREYFVTDKITFGTSTLLPGQRGDIDPGHADSHEVFFVVKGHVLLLTGTGGAVYELFAQDAIIMPENMPHTLVNIGDEEAVISWSKAPSEL